MPYRGRTFAWRLVVAAFIAGGAASFGHTTLAGEAGGPYTSAQTTGEAGCSGLPPLGPSDCDQWQASLPEGTASWTFTDDAGLTVAGASMGASGEARVVEQELPDGSLGSLTVTATLETSMISGGGASARLEVLGNYPVNASTVSVIGTAAVEGHGGILVGGDGVVEVTFGCDEEPEVDVRVHALGGAHGGEEGRLDNEAASTPISANVTVVPVQGRGNCSLRVFVTTAVGANRPLQPTDSGSGKASVSLTILAAGALPSAGPSPSASGPACAFGGTVTDGVATDGHANPLAGVLVELLRTGADEPEEAGVATDAQGRYCLPWDALPESPEGEPEPGTYVVRVQLVDGAHDPPIFQTFHGSDAEPAAATLDVGTDDLGRSDADIAFTASSAAPWLADVANIHWQSERFVRWLIDHAAIDPARISGLRISAYAETATAYRAAQELVTIASSQSTYASRDGAFANGPENAEWHEIGHHLAAALEIAPGNAFPCLLQTNHGGWSNDTTCDSLAEGFPIFLSTLASLDIDADRGPGYGLPFYALMLDLEGNTYAPWSISVGAGGRLYREDFAVAGVLWDLADTTPAENQAIPVFDRATGDLKLYVTTDRVSLGGLNVLNLLTAARPVTMAALHEFLTTSPLVDAGLRTLDVDLDVDGMMDASAIDEIFLMHGFNPLSYRVGEAIGHTPPGEDGSLADRPSVPVLPGAAVQLTNTGTGAATFTIEIGSSSGDVRRFEVRVSPGATRLVELEVPPYYAGRLPESGELPPCGEPDQQVLALSIAGPGIAATTMDSCDYLHRVVAATGGFAVAVSAAGTEPVATGAPPAGPEAGAGLPAMAVAGVAGLLIAGAVVVGVLSMRRRRS